MNNDLAQFLNGIAALALGSAAVTLSATIMRDELMPMQLKWLGAAGTVVAACVLVLAFVFRSTVIKTPAKIIALVFLLGAISVVIYLRATRVEEISVNSKSYIFMTGWKLSSYGESARRNCLVGQQRAETDYLSDYDLVKCAGPDEIGSLYNDYSAAAVIYVVSYLLLLASLTVLVASVQLIPKPSA
jgi:hypothetical protein